MALFVFLEGKMASFVSVKVYNKLEKRVSDLEAFVRSVEAYAGPVPTPDLEAEIPSIEDVVDEEAPADPMNDLFGQKIADLLKEADYPTIGSVRYAVENGMDLTEIDGVGPATFTTIQEALGFVYHETES